MKESPGSARFSIEINALYPHIEVTLQARPFRPDFVIKKLSHALTSNAGLALVGQYPKRLEIGRAFDRKFPIAKGGIANSDIIKSCLGLLVQGKNDFEAVEAFRDDAFFAQSLCQESA